MRILVGIIFIVSVWGQVAQVNPFPKPLVPASSSGSGTVTTGGCGLTGGVNAVTLSVNGLCPSASVGGTADAITAVYSPVRTSLFTGEMLSFTPTAPNATTGPTFAPDGLTAHTIVKAGATALIAGDIATNVAAILKYDATGTRWELQNPQTVPSSFPAGAGAVQVTSGTPGLVSGSASNCVLVNGSSTPCDAAGTAPVSNTTPVTVSANTTSAQVLQQLSLPAGLLNVSTANGGVYTYNGSGYYTAAALQTPTLTWTLNLCTLSGCGSGTVRALATIVTPSVVTATNNVWTIRLTISNTATGATGTVLTHGTVIAELTAASDLGTPSSDSNTASSGTIDLTAALFLQLTVTTSTGNAGNSITNDKSSLEPASAIGPTGATGPAGAGGVSYCAPASASGTTYTCSPAPALSSYAAGSTLGFVPDVLATPGAVTVNVSSLGAKSIKEADGSTNPVTGDLVAGKSYILLYDGTVFRITPALPAGPCISINTSPTWTNAGNTTFAIASAPCASASISSVNNQATTLILTGLFGSTSAHGYYDVYFTGDSTATASTVTLGSGCTWKVSGGGSGAIPTINNVANEIDKLHFEYDGTNCYASFISLYN